MNAENRSGEHARRAVVFTALRLEFTAIRMNLREVYDEVHPEGTVYERGTFSSDNGSWHVLIVEVGAGNPRAAVEVERAIRHFRPEIALFVGVAGGLKDVNLGDVVAATKVHYYESGKAEATLKPRPDTGETSYPLQQLSKAVARDAQERWLRRISLEHGESTPRAFVAPIAAGEKVVAHDRAAVRDFIQDIYGDALAVEMEGRGFLTAAHANHGVHAMVIRGISDKISGKSEADAGGSQERAARNAAAFAFEILARFGAKSGSGRSHVLPTEMATAEAMSSGNDPLSSAKGTTTSAMDLRDVNSGIPHEHIFVGREDELAALSEALLADSGEVRPVAICALQGMPGVGKSYLADHFAYLHQEAFPGGYWRLSLNPDESRSADELREILADLLGLPMGKAGDWREIQKRLLIPLSLLHIENADSQGSGEVAARIVGHLRGCRIIVTGRFQGLGRSVNWVRRLIAPFEESTAIAQLEREYRPARTTQELEEFKLLVRSLGYLPLAIHLAAGYLELEPSVPRFLTLLKSRVLDLEPSDPADPLFQRQPARSILRSTFELSIELLQRSLGRSYVTASGLHALGYAAPTGFGRDFGAAVSGLSFDEFDYLMLRAQQLSIVDRAREEPQGQGTRWRIHPLLAEILRASSDRSVVRSRITAWFLERLSVSPTQQDDAWRRWSEVHAESDALTAWLGSLGEEDRQVLEKINLSYAKFNGPCGPWIDLIQRTLRTSISLDLRAKLLQGLGSVSIQAGDYSLAMSAADENVAVCRNLHDSVGLLVALHTKAEVLAARGDARSALSIWMNEVLPIADKVDDISAASAVLMHVGEALTDVGRFDEAIGIWRDRVLPSTEGPERGIVNVRIANVLIKLGEHESALKILRQEAIPSLEPLGFTREYAMALDAMSLALYSVGQLDDALHILQDKVIPIFIRLGNESNRAVMQSRVAQILGSKGKVDEAIGILRYDVIPTLGRLGNVKEAAVAGNHLAWILSDIGRLDEALSLRLNEVLPVMEGLGDPRESAITRYNAALDLMNRKKSGDQALARELLRKAVAEALPLGIPEMAMILEESIEVGAVTPSQLLAMMSTGSSQGELQSGGGRERAEPSRTAGRVGRNEPCPCGSGKKHKKCHGGRSRSN